jgi:acetyl-CoA synthetase
MKHQIQSIEEYQQAYQKSVQDPEGFWADIAHSFQWKKPWDKTLEWNFDDLA